MTPTYKQSWKHTWLEVWTNIILGLLLSLSGNWIYLTLSGYEPTFHAMTGLAVLMTILSILRQLVLRRLFEHIRIKYHAPTKVP